MRFTAAVCLSFFFAFAVAAADLAEQTPQIERGFRPDKLYQFLDLDSVNMFNGNLIIRLPIGPAYPQSAGGAQALTLVYNAKVWDYKSDVYYLSGTAHNYRLGVPAANSNAGLGWSVSLGRLISPDDPENDENITGGGPQVRSCGGGRDFWGGCGPAQRWIYVGLDGADHPFNGTATSNNDALRSDDTASLRLRRSPDGKKMFVDMPDGGIHTFEQKDPTQRGGWRLTKITGRYGTTRLEVRYLDVLNSWWIDHEFGRRTVINFEPGHDTPVTRERKSYDRRIKSIKVQSVGDRTGTELEPTMSFSYDFHYREQTIPRGCEFVPEAAWTHVTVPLLESITMTDADDDAQTPAPEYRFTYGPDDVLNNQACSVGVVASMTVPTGATTSWSWKNFFLKSGGCKGPGGDESPGVSSRAYTVDGVTSTWQYVRKVFLERSCGCPLPDLPGCTKQSMRQCNGGHPGAVDSSTFVTSPDGRAAMYYFAIAPNDPSNPYDDCQVREWEVGLPYSRRQGTILLGGQEAALSVRVYKPGCTDVTGATCTADRETYVRYIQVRGRAAELEAERTIYKSDAGRYTQRVFSDYDGFGHFRTQTISADFRANPPADDPRQLRVTTTDYNRGINPLPSDGFYEADRWILDTYDFVQTTSDGATTKTLYCWEKSSLPNQRPSQRTGFLSMKQVVRGTKPGTTTALPGVTTHYTRDAFGNVLAEQLGFGNVDPATCALPNPWSPQFSSRHEYANGVRVRTLRLDRPGQQKHALPLTDSERALEVLDVSTDPATGLVLTSTTADGVVTTATYDAANRITSISAGGTGKSIYKYHDYNAPNRARVEILAATGAGTELSRSELEFDLLGRVAVEKQSTPATTLATRTTKYDAAGRVADVSEWRGATAVGSTKTLYDQYGRATTITAPDTSVTEISYCDMPQPCDGNGIRKVHRTQRVGTSLVSGAVTTAPVTTTETYDGLGRLVSAKDPIAEATYAYDAGNRLITVLLGAQQRRFAYDLAGFLHSETHPETSWSYDGHDATGAATRKTNTAFDLTFEYDAASRLREVRDKSLVMQEFDYDESETATGAASVRLGRLLKATRHNRFDTTDYTVTDHYLYDDAGRVRDKETVVNDGTATRPSFKSTFTYRDDEQPDKITYPSCATCGGSGRVVDLEYTNGFLTNVKDFTRPPDGSLAGPGILYHPGGMVAEVGHANGPVDRYPIDNHGMARPKVISFSGVRDCKLIEKQPSDVTAVMGASSQLTVIVSAGATVTWYRGKKDGDPTVAGSGTVLPITVDGDATYWARVSSADGKCVENTNTVHVTSCRAPAILEPAVDATDITPAEPGTKRTLSVVAQACDIQYEWHFIRIFADGSRTAMTKMIGATTSVLEQTVPAADGGRWEIYAKVIGFGGTATRLVAIIQPVTAAPPSCTSEVAYAFPGELPLLEPSVYPLVVGMNDPGTYEYQVYLNGQKATPANNKFSSTTGIARLEYTLTVNTSVSVRLVISRTNTGCTDTDPEVLETFAWNVNACPAASISIDHTTVVLDGSPNLTFVAHTGWPSAVVQWYRGDSGNTNNPLPADTGKPNQLTVIAEPATYWARVTSPCGSTADSVTLVVSAPNCSPIRFTSQPRGADIAAGQSHLLHVDATGSPAPVTYHWYSDPKNKTLAGTGASLTVRPRRTTTYWAEVSNNCWQNKAYSSALATVRITSCADIAITAQPQDTEVLAGTHVALTISSPTPGIRYQWYYGESGDTSIPAAGVSTNGTYSFTANETQKLWVRVDFGDETRCAVDSRTITVTACKPPVLKANIGNPTSAGPGHPHWLSADATGTNLQYDWFEGLPGDTSRHLANVRWVKVAPLFSTNYWVRVRSDCTIANEPAAVTGTTTVSVCPTISAPPTVSHTKVMPGQTVQLSVSADGALLRYQWFRQRNGVTEAIAGATTATITTPAIYEATSYWAVVISGYCERKSDVVQVTICAEPQIAWSRTTTDVRPGQSQILEVTVQPEANVSLYYYYKGDDGLWKLIAGPTLNRGVTVAPTKTTTYFAKARIDGSLCYDDTELLTVKVCIPTITAEPQSVLLDKRQNANATATLSVTATGDNLTYQWYAGLPQDVSKPVPNGTQSTLTISPAATTTYWVRVSGTCGVVADSKAATIELCETPVITKQPAANVINKTDTITLTVETSTLNPKFQWYEVTPTANNALTGATSSTLTIQPTTTRTFFVRVTGNCGAVDSARVMQSVRPVISTQPADSTVCAGDNASFSIGVTGADAYRWFAGPVGSNTTLYGTQASVTIPAVTASTSVWCQVSSGAAHVQSQLATATVLTLPQKTISVHQPSQQSGSTVTLSITDPVANETYTWYVGSASSGVTAGTGTQLTVAPLQTTTYTARSSRSGCKRDTAVTVTVCQPAITTQPQASTTINDGGSTRLTVAATGTPPLSYQWLSGASQATATAIAGATASFYDAAPRTDTTYWVRVSSAGASCSTLSAPALVRVCKPPVITRQPASGIINKTDTITLSVEATGDALTYQWYEVAGTATQLMSGATSSSLTITPGTTRTFFVRVTGACGSVDSTRVLQSVRPVIATQPADTAVCSGGNATFSIAASGADTVRWYAGPVGSTITDYGAGASVTLTNVTAEKTVWALLRSGDAAVNSQLARATITPGPAASITKSWAYGDNYSLKANIAEEELADTTFAWYQGAVNDTSRPAGSAQTILVYAAAPTQYWVRVTNASGCSTVLGTTVP